MSERNTFQEARERLRHLQKEVRELGEKAVKDALKTFFDKWPQVEALRWRQYTPYFNDGDECIFSVHEVTAKIAGVADDAGDYEDGFIEAHRLDRCLPADKQEEYNKLVYPPDGKEVHFPDPRSSWRTATNFSNDGWKEAQKLKTWAPGTDANLKADLYDLDGLFSEAKDALKAAFGDHVKVTATRGEIDVDQYDHE